MTWALTGEDARRAIEPEFQSLPLASIADAALSAARALGASHADVRISRQRSRSATARDARPLGVAASSSTGIGVRVLVDGVWGFASDEALTAESAQVLARAAVAMARMSAPAAIERIALAPEPP